MADIGLPGTATIAIAIGGFTIAESGSSTSANAVTAGKVIPFQQGQPSPATKVGQIPASGTE
ncbi:MAG: hypothetical protein QOF37_150 [Thermoleophilaceae bacterium]|nr:hypothetical protein [Thermoleophilaceae bacterium]